MANKRSIAWAIAKAWAAEDVPRVMGDPVAGWAVRTTLPVGVLVVADFAIRVWVTVKGMAAVGVDCAAMLTAVATGPGLMVMVMWLESAALKLASPS